MFGIADAKQNDFSERTVKNYMVRLKGTDLIICIMLGITGYCEANKKVD